MYTQIVDNDDNLVVLVYFLFWFCVISLLFPVKYVSNAKCLKKKKKIKYYQICLVNYSVS